MFSVIQDQQSRELSQGHVAKRAKKLKIEQTELKLPSVVDMAACQVWQLLPPPPPLPPPISLDTGKKLWRQSSAKNCLCRVYIASLCKA